MTIAAGLSPFPGAWFEFLGNGGAGRVKVLRTTQGRRRTASPGKCSTNG